MTELNGKQKRYLRGLANQIKSTISVGKAGITENTLLSVRNGFNTAELLKIKVQDGCQIEKDEVGEIIAKGVGASVVQVLGSTVLFYRPHPDHPKINLPQ
ncbi:MAG: YhbY family RNA-binding protein [Bacteroidetes bacterium]|nr:YhbY family RNA-binding protein [Bacteroidota bacterium]